MSATRAQERRCESLSERYDRVACSLEKDGTVMANCFRRAPSGSYRLIVRHTIYPSGTASVAPRKEG